MFLVNGQYPGPVRTTAYKIWANADTLQTLVANWGDNLEISVTNSLQHNGTGLHWHGMRQLGSNQEDGVNGITECPIAPGDTRVYRFKATQYGASVSRTMCISTVDINSLQWYHSHYSVQYGEGLVGGLIVNGPTTANYDIDLGMLPMTDWFHSSVFTVNAAALHARGPPTADNILINGSMTSAAGGSYAETILTPGKTHLLRLVNTGINNFLHIALDGHPFTVISADLTPIVPYETDSLVMAVGKFVVSSRVLPLHNMRHVDQRFTDHALGYQVNVMKSLSTQPRRLPTTGSVWVQAADAMAPMPMQQTLEVFSAMKVPMKMRSLNRQLQRHWE